MSDQEEKTLLEEVKKRQPELEKVKKWLNNGVDPNIPGVNSKERPLHYSVKNENKELVKLLLENKADPNVSDKNKFYPLHLAVEKDCTEIAKLLIQHGANVEAYTKNVGQDTPLHCAARANKPEMIKLLVDSGADVNARDKSHTDEISQTPLIVAAEQNHLDAVKALVQCNADIGIRGNINETALGIASSRGNFGIVEFLKSAEKKSRERNTLQKGSTVSDILMRIGADNFPVTSDLKENQDTSQSQRPVHIQVLQYSPKIYNTEVKNSEGSGLVIVGDSTKVNSDMKSEPVMGSEEEALEGSTTSQLQFSDQDKASSSSEEPDQTKIKDDKI